MIECLIIEGSFNTCTFHQFVKMLLERINPYPAANSVKVMDNCKIHKHPDTIKLIEEKGMHVVFLSPYSPNLNPFELAFLTIKAHLWWEGNLAWQQWPSNQSDDMDVYRQLYKLVFCISCKDVNGFFHHNAYVWLHTLYLLYNYRVFMIMINSVS